MIKKDFYITADDVGIIESVDRAVEKLICNNMVNNISVFINSDLNYNWIKKYADHLNISLHMTFSYGSPICNKELVPDLVDEKGYFKKPIKPLNGTSEEIEKSIGRYLAYLENEVPEVEIEQECLAQFEQFCKIFNRQPDFINLHHDLDKSIKIRRVIERCLPTFQTRQMLLQNQNWSGCFYEFLPEEFTFQQAFNRIIAILDLAYKAKEEKKSPVEVIFHPAYYSNELREFSSYALSRETEYNVLMKISKKQYRVRWLK